MGQGQADIPGVIAFPERLPANIEVIVEDLRQIARLGQFGEALPVKELGTGAGDKRRVGGGGEVRHLLEDFEILGVTAELVIANQHGNGVTAKNGESFVMNLF